MPLTSRLLGAQRTRESNVERLLDYGRICGVERIVRPFLEAIIREATSPHPLWTREDTRTPF
jgi:hypothetical protein